MKLFRVFFTDGTTTEIYAESKKDVRKELLPGFLLNHELGASVNDIGEIVEVTKEKLEVKKRK